MDERDQLETLWASRSAAQREALFRIWVFAATGEFAPDITISDSLGDGLVAYEFTADFSAWQVAVAGSVFDSASPDHALGIGDALIELSHLFAEQEEEAEEEAEFEEEDESAEGQEEAHDAAIEAAIDELEDERSDLEDLLPEAGDDTDVLESLIDFLNDLIDELRARLDEQEASV
jgi:hypothetical protein